MNRILEALLGGLFLCLWAPVIASLSLLVTFAVNSDVFAEEPVSTSSVLLLFVGITSAKHAFRAYCSACTALTNHAQRAVPTRWRKAMAREHSMP
jgi:hypothetical protein